MPKLYEGEHAYILQNEDQRIVFAIPYLERFTLIGTTDREYNGDPDKVVITEAETDYMLKVVNDHFKHPLSRADIVNSYSGVRPLCNDESDNPSAITRDYTLSLSAEAEQAPLLSVFGGKLTTYRKLAESAMRELAPFFTQMKGSWTATAPLPGGEDMSTPKALSESIQARYDWLPSAIAQRWALTYGSRVWRLLEGVQGPEDLGEAMGGGLFAREVDYLCSEEWATSAEDILWRRTKLGLFTSPAEQEKLKQYLLRVALNRSKSEAA